MSQSTCSNQAPPTVLSSCEQQPNRISPSRRRRLSHDTLTTTASINHIKHQRKPYAIDLTGTASSLLPMPVWQNDPMLLTLPPPTHPPSSYILSERLWKMDFPPNFLEFHRTHAARPIHELAGNRDNLAPNNSFLSVMTGWMMSKEDFRRMMAHPMRTLDNWLQFLSASEGISRVMDFPPLPPEDCSETPVSEERPDCLLSVFHHVVMMITSLIKYRLALNSRASWESIFPLNGSSPSDDDSNLEILFAIQAHHPAVFQILCHDLWDPESTGHPQSLPPPLTLLERLIHRPAIHHSAMVAVERYVMPLYGRLRGSLSPNRHSTVDQQLSPDHLMSSPEIFLQCIRQCYALADNSHERKSYEKFASLYWRPNCDPSTLGALLITELRPGGCLLALKEDTLKTDACRSLKRTLVSFLQPQSLPFELTCCPLLWWFLSPFHPPHPSAILSPGHFLNPRDLSQLLYFVFALFDTRRFACPSSVREIESLAHLLWGTPKPSDLTDNSPDPALRTQLESINSEDGAARLISSHLSLSLNQWIALSLEDFELGIQLYRFFLEGSLIIHSPATTNQIARVRQSNLKNKTITTPPTSPSKSNLLLSPSRSLPLKITPNTRAPPPPPPPPPPEQLLVFYVRNWIMSNGNSQIFGQSVGKKAFLQLLERTDLKIDQMDQALLTVFGYKNLNRPTSRNSKAVFQFLSEQGIRSYQFTSHLKCLERIHEVFNL